MTAQSRMGALLPAVLAAMVFIGLAASAALYMARNERGESATALLVTSVVATADESEVAARAAFERRASMLAPGEAAVQRVSGVNPRAHAAATLAPLGPSTFVLDIDTHAFDLQGRAAKRRSVVMLRLRPPRLDFNAALALTGAGPAPAGVADGGDHPAPAGECTGDSLPVPDVVHPSTSTDSAALDGLRARPSLRLSANSTLFAPGPVLRDGECDVARPTNWGDPSATTACAAWRPVVHAPGNLRVTGGEGQGVLLVEGDLEVSGGFRFSGAVIVGGTLTIGSGGTELIGAVRARTLVDASGVSGNAPFITRSSCALRAALRAAGELVPLAERPWALLR